MAVAPPDEAPEPPAEAKTPFDTFAVYNRVVDGCVYIVRETDDGPVESTGALIDAENRLVLTTYRAVGDSDVVSVQFPYRNLDGTVETNRKEYARSAAAKLTPMGRVIRRNKARDLALVRLDRLGRHARPIELAETGIRDKALHLGAGTGELFSYTVRAVVPSESAQIERITLSGTTDDTGGPLVDRDGRLVGLVAGPAGQGVTLAIGLAEVRAFLAEKDKESPAPKVDPVVKKQDPPLIPNDVVPPIDPIPRDFDPESAILYKKWVDSTVFIVTPTKAGHSEGVGSLIDAEKRYVLTTYRVVGEEDSVFCQFPVHQKDGSILTEKKKYFERIPAGQAIRGKVLFRDKTRDLAIIQLDRLPATARAIKLAPKSVGIGETVITIGNPEKANTTFAATTGKVRAVGMEDMLVNGPDGMLRIKARMATITNPITAGDSGGPVIDRRGYLVGVTEYGPVGAALGKVTDVTEVLTLLKEKKIVIKDLPDEKAEPKKDAKPPEKSEDPPPKAAPPEQERAANQLLQRARLFADGEENRATYVRKLKEVIEKHPGTAAGREARKILDGLK